ncbi:MAG TPA: hypothetical protein VFZ27_08705 [Terriglobia bacterium]|nr:hypothetical protein [Terriglobia bacterium]
MVETRFEYRRAGRGAGVLVGGAMAGILGGIIMGGGLTLWAWFTGMGASLPWQLIAGTYYGPMAMVGAAGVTAIGVLTHLTIAAAFGVLFAAITVRHESAGHLFLWGIVFGVAVWAFMTYAIVPVFDTTINVRIPMFALFFFFMHLVFGAFTGLFTPPLRRSMTFTSAGREVVTVERAA